MVDTSVSAIVSPTRELDHSSSLVSGWLSSPTSDPMAYVGIALRMPSVSWNPSFASRYSASSLAGLVCPQFHDESVGQFLAARKEHQRGAPQVGQMEYVSVPDGYHAR
jgi:hypothetical protein